MSVDLTPLLQVKRIILERPPKDDSELLALKPFIPYILNVRSEQNQVDYEKYKKSEAMKGFIEHIKQRLQVRDFYQSENDFPYDFLLRDVNWRDYILWYKPEIVAFEIPIRNLLDNTVFYIETPLTFQSIPQVRHIHVFVKQDG